MFTRRALFGGILGALGLVMLRACVTGPVPQATRHEPRWYRFGVVLDHDLKDRFLWVEESTDGVSWQRRNV